MRLRLRLSKRAIGGWVGKRAASLNYSSFSYRRLSSGRISSSRNNFFTRWELWIDEGFEDLAGRHMHYVNI